MLSPKQTWAEGETRSVCGCQVRLSPQNLICPDFRHLPLVWRLIAQGKAGRQRFLCLWVCVFVRTADRNRKQKADVPSGGNSQPSPYGMSSAHQSCRGPSPHLPNLPLFFPLEMGRQHSQSQAALSKSALQHHLSLLSGSSLGSALTLGSRLWPHLVFCVSVSGERPFQCRYCPYSASQKGNLKTHVQTVHRLSFDNAQYPDRRLRQAPTNEPTDPSESHWAFPPAHDQLKWGLKSIKGPSKMLWCTNTAFEEDLT